MQMEVDATGEMIDPTAKADLNNHFAAVDNLLTELEQEDLVAVAAYTFMDKQLWFLKQLDKLQVPYRDGCIRMEIRRECLLLDTVVLVGGLTPRDMHKWWRVQFAGEAGIDAGGLEREWFSWLRHHYLIPTRVYLPPPPVVLAVEDFILTQQALKVKGSLEILQGGW